jgi:hypothetical protein
MGILHDYLIVCRCAERLSSDCRETPSGSGADRQHATLGAEMEAANGNASQLRTAAIWHYSDALIGFKIPRLLRQSDGDDRAPPLQRLPHCRRDFIELGRLIAERARRP